MIAKNLADIAEDEGARIEPEGLALIARAAEGSVRDAQSLLDQAIVQARRRRAGHRGRHPRHAGPRRPRADHRALRARHARPRGRGAARPSATLYGFGADPVVVLLDLLEHAHGASLAKALGPDVLGLPKDQAAQLAAIGAQASAGTLAASGSC